jgi:hypothetical protein
MTGKQIMELRKLEARAKNAALDSANEATWYRWLALGCPRSEPSQSLLLKPKRTARRNHAR